MFKGAGALLSLLSGLVSLVRSIFPSADNKLGRAEQALKDTAASQAAEQAKHAVPAAPAAAVDDSLEKGEF